MLFAKLFDSMQRYSLQEARRYISKALIRLKKVLGLNLALLDLEYADLMGWDFIKAHMYDKTTNTKFDSMFNEFMFFKRDDCMQRLDAEAKIDAKKLDDKTKTILRVAYTIWRDWKGTKNVNMN